MACWLSGTRTLVVSVRWLSCSTACGIFLDQGLNKCSLCRQADSYLLCHQGSPKVATFKLKGAGHSPFKALGKKSAQFLDFIFDFIAVQCAVLRWVTQLCLTLCDIMDCSPPGSSVHEDSPGKNSGIGCNALLQWIFRTQGLNPDLPHCRSEPPRKPSSTV